MRHPLARALAGVAMDATDVAARLGVDPKTVGCWLAGRVPYPRHRAALAELTGWATGDLWPELTPPTSPGRSPDLRLAYPRRAAVPAHVWRRHFTTAEVEIGILAYSALFLAEDPTIQDTLRDKAHAGVRVRLALGAPDGTHIQRRGAEEGIHDLVTARIRNALILFEPVAAAGAEIRLHDTILYNSIYRADDEILVNSHVYGAPAAHTPVLHLHRTHDGGLATQYLDSFERVWNTAATP